MADDEDEIPKAKFVRSMFVRHADKDLGEIRMSVFHCERSGRMFCVEEEFVDERDEEVMPHPYREGETIDISDYS